MLPDINSLMEQYDNNANAGRVAESDLTAEPMTSKEPLQTSIKESDSLTRCCFFAYCIEGFNLDLQKWPLLMKRRHAANGWKILAAFYGILTHQNLWEEQQSNGVYYFSGF